MNSAYALHASSHRNRGGDGSRVTRPLGAVLPAGATRAGELHRHIFAPSLAR